MAFNRDRNSRSRFGNRGDRGPVTMHKAICDNCRKECEVPFRPTSGKPIYCSNCFGEKKNAGTRNPQQPLPRFTEQLEALNSKLDKILGILMPIASEKP